MTVRKYTSRSQQTTLTSAITSGATSMAVSSASTLLATVGQGEFVSGATFTVVIDPDTSIEEIVDITAASSNTFTITRSVDAVGTAQDHSAGAIVRHMIIGRDLREPNEHIEATGQVHGLLATSGVVMGTLATQTMSNKTLGSNLAAGTYKITGLGDPSSAQDAATKNYVDTGMSSQVVAAASSATASASSATAAATSATSAAASATAAATSATSAAASATAAATSATSAAASAVTAANSVATIAGYATTASNSASAAATSATSAAASATAAATSATSSATSASAAATSASSAATSASSAATSAASAATSAASAAAVLTGAFDAKGDLLVGTGTNTFDQLTVAATNGYVLSVNSATATGLEWTAANPGDITGVTAGTGLTGGGTSGAVTVSLDTTSAYVVPSQTGQSGKYLTTNGTTSSWGAIDALPSQTGNAGEFLTTDGTTASWAVVAGSLAQPTEPTSPTDGQIWVDTDGTALINQLLRWSKAPANGTTTLSGNDDNSLPLTYSVGYEQVFQNGALLARGSDYTATNGTSISLTNASVTGDIFEVFAAQPVAISDVYTQTQANAAFINDSLLTTTGDIIYASGANTPARLGIGTTNQVLKVSGGLPAWGAAPTPTFVGCSLYKSGNQAVANGTSTAITFDLELFDTNGFHDNSTNNSRITIPSGYAGKYLITGVIQWASSSTGIRVNDFKLNGSTFLGYSYMDANGYQSCAVTMVQDLVVGDYIEMIGYQNSGGSLGVGGGGRGESYFAITYLGA